MKLELFIYLTNQDELNMAGGGYAVAPPLSKDFPFYLLPSKELRAELDKSCTPSAILILDEIDIKIFDKEILKLEDKYSVIYVAYHTQGRQKEEINNPHNKMKFMSIQHFPPDPIYRMAIDFIKLADNPEETERITERTRLEFEGYHDLNSHILSFDVDPFLVSTTLKNKQNTLQSYVDNQLLNEKKKNGK